MSINKHEKVQKKRTPYTKEHYSFVTGVQFTPPPGFNNLEWLMGGGGGVMISSLLVPRGSLEIRRGLGLYHRFPALPVRFLDGESVDCDG